MRGFLRIFSILVILAGVPVGIYLVGQKTGFWGKASGATANLVIDLAQAFPDSNFTWKNLAQGGEEKVRMLESVTGKIAAIHPNYIRIDHIFDFYNIENGWSSLDATISDITATGAKPFISISPLPETPINWSDWESKVQNLVQHISGTLGINNVYYEVGNEPDLFGGWKTYGNKNYLDLYSHCVASANRASGVRNFKIGGPATTALYENWTKGLAKFVSQNNLRLDFYSWHRYSMNLDDFELDAGRALSWLTESGFSPNTELIISEAGPDSENNKAYDNGFGYIHAIATAATLEDSVGKFFNFEIKDGPGPTKFWNRWGLFTNDKFGAPESKPRYNAFFFLNNMTGNRVKVTGQGSWIKSFAKSDGKILKTLVVNYDPAGVHSEAVPLNFVNLPIKNFTFKRINENGGVEKNITVTPEGTSWSTIELMNPNTAAIFEIIP